MKTKPKIFITGFSISCILLLIMLYDSNLILKIRYHILPNAWLPEFIFDNQKKLFLCKGSLKHQSFIHPHNIDSDNIWIWTDEIGNIKSQNIPLTWTNLSYHDKGRGRFIIFINNKVITEFPWTTSSNSPEEYLRSYYYKKTTDAKSKEEVNRILRKNNLPECKPVDEFDKFHKRANSSTH